MSKCSVSEKDFELFKEASLRETFNNKSFTDVTLVCNDDNPIDAHRIILSAQSLFFNRILKVNDKRDMLIYLPNIASEQMNLILTFIYLGQAEVSENELEKFLSFGKVFEIKGLSEQHFNALDDQHVVPKIKEEGYEDGTLVIGKSLLKRLQNGKFPCDQCSFQSVTRRGVKKHQDSIHLGITHVCDECPKEYSDPSALKSHKQNAHDGISYKCDLCNKVYSNHKSLLKHEREHRGIGTSCPRCEESFRSEGKLRHHIEKQHDGVKYKCDNCDYVATRKFSLKEHINSVHNVN